MSAINTEVALYNQFDMIYSSPNRETFYAGNTEDKSQAPSLDGEYERLNLSSSIEHDSDIVPARKEAASSSQHPTEVPSGLILSRSRVCNLQNLPILLPVKT